MNNKFLLGKIWISMTHPFRPTYTANVCGHKTEQKGFMHEFENITIMQMPLAENGKPDYCLECIGNMSIKCAWCANPISIGSPITLYTPKDTFKVPDYAVAYTENGSKALVGCLGWDCARTGADMCGRWMPPGKVEVIVGNTHDPSSISLHPLEHGSETIQ